MTRRRVALILLALIPVGMACSCWSVFHFPPPRLLLAHGLPGGGATGASCTILGVGFVELRPGYVYVDRHRFCDRGDFLGRIFAPLGIPLGEPPAHYPENCRYWAEIPEPVWIATTELSSSWISDQVYDLKPEDEKHLEASEAVLLIGGEISGNLRMATEREWDYAFLTGVIRVEPGSIEFEQSEDGSGEGWLQRPDEERHMGFFGVAAYRLIWLPSEAR